MGRDVASIRNLVILAICQLISTAGAIVVVTLGGIIGSQLSGNEVLATLPVSVMVVCLAATTIPATMLMRKIGRRLGFALASFSAAASVLSVGMALHNESFLIFTGAAAVFGINMAFTQQYRYAAAESVEARFAPRAISIVLLGSIGGALLGPELVTYGQHAISNVEHMGTLFALSILYLAQALLFLALAPSRSGADLTGRVAPRPLRQIVSQPFYVVAVLGGVASYGVMTFIMTATPLSMHLHDGFSLAETARVIRSHVLGMYVPSLVSGYLIERLGVVRMMTLGVIVLIAACMIGIAGHSLPHYWYTLTLLGVGWNFLYVGGTTLLTRTYRPQENFKAQAVNEFCVFSTSATGSLLAGTILYSYGWYALVLAPLPVLGLMLAGLYFVRKTPVGGRLAPEVA